MKSGACGWSIHLPDEPATLLLAGRMAGCLPDGPFVFYLQGDLGSGKTTLARGLLRALGEQGAVRSPTYGLINGYETPLGRVLHLDLYRLRAPEELMSLGLADHVAETRVWLIEWPERGDQGALPAADVRVLIGVEGAGRRMGLQAASHAGRQWLECLGPDSV